MHDIMNNNYEYIGYTGTFLISINLIPQVYHIYKIKNAESISTLSIVLNILSAIVMIAYGLLIQKMPIVISNGMIFIFNCNICYFKYIYNDLNEYQERKSVKIEISNQKKLMDQKYDKDQKHEKEIEPTHYYNTLLE